MCGKLPTAVETENTPFLGNSAATTDSTEATGPGTSTFFFTVKPCSLKVSVWMGFMFWIPKFDITILTSYTSLWYGGVNSLKWKSVICKGVDDGYSFCGALKGETINTTVRISGAQPTYDQGEYTFVFKAFSGYYKDLALCMNYTFIIKEKLYG
ncbi:lymphocyte antigen 96 isoform X2 [Pogona vitticeps]